MEPWMLIVGIIMLYVLYLMVSEFMAVRRIRVKMSKAIPYPPSPCGNDKEHYEWEEEVGWNCPHCAAIKMENDEFQKRQRDINDLADAVAKRIKEWEGQK